MVYCRLLHNRITVVCKIHSAYVSKFYTYLSLTQQKLVFAYSHAKNTKEREHKHDIVPLLVFACYNFALSRGQVKGSSDFCRPKKSSLPFYTKQLPG